MTKARILHYWMAYHLSREDFHGILGHTALQNPSLKWITALGNGNIAPVSMDISMGFLHLLRAPSQPRLLKI